MLLVGYAERGGTPTFDGVEIELDRTQEELAQASDVALRPGR